MFRNLYSFLIITAAAWGMSCISSTRSLAVGEVCGEKDNTHVRVEGFFRLPQAADWVADNGTGSGEYRLIFVEKLTGGGSFIKATIPGTLSHEPNRIEALPASYTYDDLKINTSSGKTVSADEKLTVVGKISNGSKPCILQVEKIESSQ